MQGTIFKSLVTSLSISNLYFSVLPQVCSLQSKGSHGLKILHVNQKFTLSLNLATAFGLFSLCVRTGLKSRGDDRIKVKLTYLQYPVPLR